MSAIRKIPFLIAPIRKVRGIIGDTPDVLSLRNLKKATPDLIAQNLSRPEPRLQIGCQSHPFDGWLNVDIDPKAADIGYMDATERFPLPDGVFATVYSEHMIEHISLEQGMFMLGECYRVMKPGAVIRIVTPNLRFIIDFYTDQKSDTQLGYQAFSRRYFNQPAVFNDAVIINNFFRDWGHQFIYDEKTLHEVFRLAGFSDIRTCNVYESEHAVLQNIEHHHLEITDEFNRLESIVVEAVKK